jgi:CMP-N-acetylneuraminic acid synthetase
MDPITFFLPTRRGSQRVVNKNTRVFSDLPGGLLELKLLQLIQCTTFNEIVLSTNDEESVKVAAAVNNKTGGKIRIEIRPENLCTDDTPLTELINYVPQIIQNGHIIWCHVTTPFVTATDYDYAVRAYFSALQSGFDSLVTVKKFQNFLIKPGSNQIYNTNSAQSFEKWPRTQDLPSLYEVNHAMFITSRDVYLTRNDRIGANIYFHEMNTMKSFDIDWEDDFLIAEAIYEKLYRH